MKTRSVDVYSREYNRETRTYDQCLKDKGQFHMFGVQYEEFDTGPGNYTVAVVELSTGKVVTPDANLIKFTSESQATQNAWYHEQTLLDAEEETHS